jgi:hypothetical protein
MITALYWVSSQQKTLDEVSMTEVNEFLRYNILEWSQFLEVVQTSCAAVPSAEF